MTDLHERPENRWKFVFATNSISKSDTEVKMSKSGQGMPVTEWNGFFFQHLWRQKWNLEGHSKRSLLPLVILP